MNCTIIKDPVMEPFHISKDQYCFTVVETIKPGDDTLTRFGRKRKAGAGIDYERKIGHYSSLSNALFKIAKFKVDTKPEYDSIKSYIEDWEQNKIEMQNLLNKLGI